MKQLIKKGQTIWAYLFTILAAELKTDEALHAGISEILQQYPDAFEEPTTLLP